MVVTEFTPWASAIGGALIGLASVLLLLFSGRIAGIIGIVRRAVLPGAASRPLEAAAFLGGLIASALLWPMVSGQAVQQSVSPNAPLLAIAGLLVGFGATWANGCTSGHGVCGVSRLSVRSIVATLTFMAAGIVTVFITRHVLGA